MPGRLGGIAELVLVRHGESVGNLADRRARERRAPRLELATRDADVPLSPAGEHQAVAVGQHLRELKAQDRPTLVLASPYRRAADTAARALAGVPCAPAPRYDERLRERDLGIFDGLTGSGITAEFPQEAARRARMGKFYYRPPSGESWCDVALRVRSVLADLSGAPGPERVWVFSHQAVIMAFRLVLEGLSEQQVLAYDAKAPLANCSMTTYGRDSQGRLHLLVAGDTAAVDRSAAPLTHEPESLDKAAHGGSRGR